MKTYSYIEAIDSTPGYIQLIDEQGIVWNVPNDPANKDYQEYLRYTAWVEVGNAPEDFWTQNNV